MSETPPRRGDRLTPPPDDGATSSARPLASPRPSERRGNGGRWFLVLTALLAVAAFVLLPRLAERVEPTTTEETSPAAPVVTSPTETSESKAATDEERLAEAVEQERARRAAREALERAESLRERLVTGSVDKHWAVEDLRQADARLAEGRRLLDEDRPMPAQEILEQAVESYEAIEASTAAALSDALSETRRALESDDATRAQLASERALKVSPDSGEAQDLAERVAVFPQVLTALSRARVAEREQRWADAITAHERALAIDGRTARARAGLERARAGLANASFHGTLASLRDALDRRDFDAARDLLARARKQRPDAAALGPLQQQLDRLVTETEADRLAGEGRTLEASEDWSRAIERYVAVLKLVPQHPAALEGKARSERWADLSRRLDAHLDRADRLSAAEVLDEARSLLVEAQLVESPGPRHQQRIRRLEETIASAAQPVAVTLESDDSTEVTVYRVGRLGRFRQQVLELRPGRYTVTGSRAGYRDVRHELVVKAGAPTRLHVACRERI
ncbi:MAG: hypothetical protein AAF533_15805 [Acidobacteriota bacterium]